MAMSNPHYASSRRMRPLGLLVAGGILFVIGIGGSGALMGASTNAVIQSAVDHGGGTA
jgi:hypothetical protein